MEKNNVTGAPDKLYKLEIGGKTVELDMEQLLSAAKLGLMALAAEKGGQDADSAAPNDELESRIAAIEQRLSAVEKNYSNREKSMGSARGNAADGELTELEAVYDAVFRR